MAKSTSPNSSSRADINRQKLSPERYARLKAEVKAPYRGLRKFIYVAFGASGFIGAVIFLAQLPNLALQIGIVALMIWLFRWERKVERKS